MTSIQYMNSSYLDATSKLFNRFFNEEWYKVTHANNTDSFFYLGYVDTKTYTHYVDGGYGGSYQKSETSFYYNQEDLKEILAVRNSKKTEKFRISVQNFESERNAEMYSNLNNMISSLSNEQFNDLLMYMRRLLGLKEKTEYEILTSKILPLISSANISDEMQALLTESGTDTFHNMLSSLNINQLYKVYDYVLKFKDPSNDSASTNPVQPSCTHSGSSHTGSEDGGLGF